MNFLQKVHIKSVALHSIIKQIAYSLPLALETDFSCFLEENIGNYVKWFKSNSV